MVGIFIIALFCFESLEDILLSFITMFAVTRISFPRFMDTFIYIWHLVFMHLFESKASSVVEHTIILWTSQKNHLSDLFTEYVLLFMLIKRALM